MPRKKKILFLELPIPISANRMLDKSRRNGLRRSDQYKLFRSQVGWIARAEGAYPHAGEVIAIIHIYRKSKRGDLDNFIKPLLDSLNGIAYVDDKQVCQLHVHRHEDKNNPRATIKLVYKDIECRK
jgi:Holliday junction resolvase RusA-like endonuclease